MSELAPLCSLVEVKAFLYPDKDPTVATDQDAELERLIDYATAAITGMLDMPRHEDGRPAQLGEDTYRETYDGNGGTSLVLRRAAITRILGVEVSGARLAAANDTTAPGFLRSRFGVKLRGYCFARGVSNVVVTYQAGLGDDDPLFAELKQAAIELVALVTKTKPFIGIQSKTLAEQTVVYMQGAMPSRTTVAVERLKLRWAA